jgi:hypothetical protein
VFGFYELDVTTSLNHDTTNAKLTKVMQCAQKASLELGISSSKGKEILTSIRKLQELSSIPFQDDLPNGPNIQSESNGLSKKNRLW